MYGYLEKLILEGTKTLNDFISLFFIFVKFRIAKSDVTSVMREEYKEARTTLIEMLRKLVIILVNEGNEKALQELLRATLLHPTFDTSMVSFLRYVVGDFILRNPYLPINEISINSIVQSEGKDLNEFVMSSVVKDKEHAIDCVHVVIPLVLRISLTYILLNMNERANVRVEIKK
jgi:hypothetical protein